MTGGLHIVKDVMTRNVVSVSPATTFKEIVRILLQGKVSAVPVVDADRGVLGIVSEADLVPKEEFRDSSPSRLGQLRRLDDLLKAGSERAADLMTSPAVTIASDVTLSQAAQTMARHKVKRLPVTGDDGRLSGIVSRGDLLKVFLRDDADIAEEVRREILAYLFPGDPCPVLADVSEGVVTLRGRIADTSRVPVAARLVRAVEGVVDVSWDLASATGPGADRPPPTAEQPPSPQHRGPRS